MDNGLEDIDALVDKLSLFSLAENNAQNNVLALGNVDEHDEQFGEELQRILGSCGVQDKDPASASHSEDTRKSVVKGLQELMERDSALTLKCVECMYSWAPEEVFYEDSDNRTLFEVEYKRILEANKVDTTDLKDPEPFKYPSSTREKVVRGLEELRQRNEELSEQCHYFAGQWFPDIEFLAEEVHRIKFFICRVLI